MLSEQPNTTACEDTVMYQVTATLNATGNRFSYDMPYCEAQDMFRELTVYHEFEYSDVRIERI